MAIAGGDGSIILTTRVDQTGLKRGLSSIQTGVRNTSSALMKLGGALAAAFSVSALVNFSKTSANIAASAEADAQRIIRIYGQASEAVGDFIDANARALGMSRAAATSFAAVYGNLFSVWADQATNANLTNQYLQMTAVVASQTGRTVEDVSERIRSGLLGNTEAVEDLGIFVNIKTIEMTEAFMRIADGRPWDQLTAYEQAQVRSLAILEQATNKYGSSVANNAIFARAQFTAAYQDFQATWGQVVNTILLPVLQVATQVLNVLTAGMQIIAGMSGAKIEAPKVVDAEIQSGLGAQPVSTNAPQSAGSNSKPSDDPQTDAIDAEIDAIEEKIKALEKENKQIRKNAKENELANKKQLASFDTLNILQTNQLSEEDKTIEANNDEIDKLREQLDLLRDKRNEIKKTASDYAKSADAASVGGVSGGVTGGSYDLGSATMGDMGVGEINGNLALIMGAAGAALVAVGLILLLYGNIAWGIGFIIAGAVVFTVAEANFTQSDYSVPISAQLATIMGIVGTVLVAIGLILLFMGNIPWGIGFIIAGAGTLKVTESAINQAGFDQAQIETILGTIMNIAGGALVAIGLIVFFMGLIPLGLGFIAVGAYVFNAGEEKVAENDTEGKVKGMLDNIQSAAGLALLALGVILLLTVSAIPIGLGLIVAGAAALADAEEENTQKVLNNVKDFLKAHEKEIVKVAVAVLIIGVILLCMGIIPLGLGAVIFGGTVLAKSETPEADKIRKSIQKFKEENGAELVGVSLALLIIGVILMLSGVGFAIGLGLLVSGAVILAESEKEDTQLVANKISTWIENNKALFTVISGAVLLIGIILCCTGVALPLGIGLVVVGAAILAEEVSENATAIMTKISTFISDNKDLFTVVSGALLIVGIILCFTGVALPLALGLIAVGATILVETLYEPDWEAIGKSIDDFIEENKTAIVTLSAALLVIGIILIFTGAGLGLGLGLIIAAGALLGTAVDWSWDGLLDSLKETWKNIKEWWNKTVSKVFTAEFWKDLGIDMLNGLIAGVEGGINGIINGFESMVNFLIKALNKISIDVPDWLGGGKFGFDLPLADFGEVKLPRIPKLAKGGVIPYRMIAEVGEDGREAVIPLEKNTEWMDILAEKVITKMGGNNGTTVVLEVDGREFGRAVIEQGNKESRRIGTRLVTV